MPKSELTKTIEELSSTLVDAMELTGSHRFTVAELLDKQLQDFASQILLIVNTHQHHEDTST